MAAQRNYYDAAVDADAVVAEIAIAAAAAAVIAVVAAVVAADGDGFEAAAVVAGDVAGAVAEGIQDVPYLLDFVR